jgi:hypothetical protein
MATVIVVVASMFIGYLSAASGLDEISREWRSQLNVFLIYVWGGVLSIVFLHGIFWWKIFIRFPWQYYYAYLMGVSVSLLLSQHISPILLIGAVFFALCFTFLKLKHSELLVSKYLIIFMCFWQVIPILLDFTGWVSEPPLYWFDGFRGLAFDRVEYAFYVGFSIIILVVDKRFSGLWFWILVAVLAYGVFISQSRFVYLALFVALLVYYGLSKRLFIAILFISLIFFMSYFLAGREDITSFGRSDLYLGWLSHVLRNLDLLIFGSGEFYESYNDGDIPHNFILQSILNYGFMGLIAWLLLVGKFLSKLKNSGRSIIAYLIVFGLFHPGVDAFLVTPMIGVVFLFALGMDDGENYLNKDGFKHVVQL